MAIWFTHYTCGWVQKQTQLDHPALHDIRGAPGERRVAPNNVHFVVSHRLPNIMEADACMGPMAHISGSCRASRAHVEYFAFPRHVARK